MSSIRTLVCNYYATGEGVTTCVLFTRAPLEEAEDRFGKIFGSWYAYGLTVFEGLNFEFENSDLLVSDAMREVLRRWTTGPEEDQPGGLEYFAQTHFNFS